MSAGDALLGWLVVTLYLAWVAGVVLSVGAACAWLERWQRSRAHTRAVIDALVEDSAELATRRALAAWRPR